MSDTQRKRLLELDAQGKSTFAYRSSANTDLAATFARIRRQQKLAAEPVKAAPNVCQIKKASAK
jgi:hypothetical protein